MARLHHWLACGEPQFLSQALRPADVLCDSAIEQEVGCCWMWIQMVPFSLASTKVPVAWVYFSSTAMRLREI
jgi:hypothetical protein